LPGGNSFKFDWRLLDNYSFSKPFFLSGGIGLKEISEIKEIIKSNLPIHAIDVNSKFEIYPGEKNIELLKKFKLKLFK
jgi:phosphoribosylanthranilate isomerase